jgi:DNA helicase II / ATP-dependent DNA helicase PcrA
LVLLALQETKDRILITTYTRDNEATIRQGFIDIHGCIPAHVTILSWYSWLLRDGVRPYRNKKLSRRVSGMAMVNSASELRRSADGETYAIPERDQRHYLTQSGMIFSDKVAKFTVLCHEATDGLVMKRMEGIYDAIFIDEYQDLAGYDLEILRLLFASRMRVLLVGDPRQCTYATHQERKHKKYSGGKAREFIEEQCRDLEVAIDAQTLSQSYRCNAQICALASLTFDARTAPMQSCAVLQNAFRGLFLVHGDAISSYLRRCAAVQLRYDASAAGVDPGFRVMNIGKAKGLTFDHVLIFPTDDMARWIIDPSRSLNDKTRAKLYVAITRARHSVGVVMAEMPAFMPAGFQIYEPGVLGDGT